MTLNDYLERPNYLCNHVKPPIYDEEGEPIKEDYFGLCNKCFFAHQKLRKQVK